MPSTRSRSRRSSHITPTPPPPDTKTNGLKIKVPKLKATRGVTATKRRGRSRSKGRGKTKTNNRMVDEEEEAEEGQERVPLSSITATPANSSNSSSSSSSSSSKKTRRSRSRSPRVDKSSPTALNAVEQQTQLAQQEGTMQNAIMKGNYDLFFELLGNEEDPLEVLRERDAVGATCLHWACLMNHQPGSLRIAHRIIQKYPERCADMYTGEEYEVRKEEKRKRGRGKNTFFFFFVVQLFFSRVLILFLMALVCNLFFSSLFFFFLWLVSNFYKGENSLHIAIVNQNFELVRALVEAGPEQMEQHATGLFFSPSTEKKKVSCYYGELALR